MSASLERLTLTVSEIAGEQLTMAVSYAAGWGQLRIQAWFWPSDFTDFMHQLRELYNSLTGQAVLKPRYGEECVLTLRVDHLGRIDGTIHLEYLEDRFDGVFQCDQSYLPDFLSDLQTMWTQATINS